MLNKTQAVMVVMALIAITATPWAGAMDGAWLQTGLLVDVVNGQAYVMQPGGGIAQIEVATGNRGWLTLEADRPVLLQDGRLMAQIDSTIPGTLELQTIDSVSGAALMRSRASLPETVVPLIDEGLGSKFEMRWAEGKSAAQQPTLLWRHQKRLISGAAMVDAPEPQKQAGLLAIDGNSLKNLPSTSKAAFEKLWLDSRSSKSITTNDPAGRQFLSQDAGHLLTSTHTDEAGDRLYRWQIEEIGGEKLGQINATMSYSPFLVVGTVVVYVTQPFSQRQASGELYHQGLTLVAVDVSSGKPLWKREIRDTRYRGPFPS